MLTQISLPWQQGSSGVNLNDTVKLAVPENHTPEPNVKWIGWPVAEILPFEFLELRGRSFVVGRRPLIANISGMTQDI